MATRGPREMRGKNSQRVDPVTPCPSRVQQSLALDSAVTLLHATQGVLVEHMWTLSRERGRTMDRLHGPTGNRFTDAEVCSG